MNVEIAAMLVTTSLLGGCARAPSPLTPQWEGSIGTPSLGVLTHGVALPSTGDGYRWLRHDERHYGLPRFAAVLERVAGAVARERPGATLVVGDLSVARGGQLLPHFSHRTGRDVDLLLYVTTLDGAPVDSPGFVHFDADGLARDEKNDRFLRFDVEREWLLVKALLTDPEARAQWIFVNHMLEAMLVEWATARGEPSELVLRAERVMAEPSPGGLHDDHIHVRTACAPEDVAGGCEPSGPQRPWLAFAPATDETAVEELVLEVARPIDASGATAGVD